MTITIFDFETGGLNELENPITEIGMLNIDVNDFHVNWEYNTFVKPYAGMIITKEALEQTLVNEKDIQNGIELEKAVKDMIKLFKQSNSSNGKPSGNTIMCGHNVTAFDRRFIEMAFELCEKNVYDYISGCFHDTLADAHRAWCTPKDKHNLKACCQKIGYNLTGAHGAMNDVRATFELYKYFSLKLRGNSVKQITPQTNNEGTASKKVNHRNHFQF